MCITVLLLQLLDAMIIVCGMYQIIITLSNQFYGTSLTRLRDIQLPSQRSLYSAYISLNCVLITILALYEIKRKLASRGHIVQAATRIRSSEVQGYLIGSILLGRYLHQAASRRLSLHIRDAAFNLRILLIGPVLRCVPAHRVRRTLNFI